MRAEFTARNVKSSVARKLSDGLRVQRLKRDGYHGGPSRIAQNLTRKDSSEVSHEEEALARRCLDRAGWWHRCFDRLSSRLRADCRISPLILASGSVRSIKPTPASAEERFFFLSGGRIRLSSGTRLSLTHSSRRPADATCAG